MAEISELSKKLEQREAEIAVINSVQEGILAQKEMQEIYDLVGDKIRDLFDAQVVLVSTFNHDNNTEVYHYAFEAGERHYVDPRPFDKLRQKLIETDELILINENVNDAWKKITGELPSPPPGTKFPKSALFVPMAAGDTVFGYISLQNVDREHAFSDSDVRTLSTMANSISLALENARLFNETEQRNAELAVINSVQEGLVAEMDLQGIYDLVGDRIQELFDAQVVSIATFSHETSKEHFQYNFEDGERFYPDPRQLDNFRKRLIDAKELILINENFPEQAEKIMGFKPEPVPGTELPKSALFVPLVLGDSVKGYVSLQNLDHEQAFPESDVRLLSTLANSMSVAIENARLFDETARLLAETEQRNAELAVINSVQDGLVREMDMAAIYKLVGEKICDVLDTQAMVIRTFDHDSGLEHWQYAVENEEEITVEPQPFIFANKILIDNKEPLFINDGFEEFAASHGERASTTGLAPKSVIFVPMIISDVVIGSVSLQNVEKENAFSESDLQLITTLTNSMSVAIENARLFNETTRLLSETEQRAAELQTVNNISRAMVSKLELDALISLVGEQMRKTFRADIVYLATYDRKSNMLHFPYYYGDKSESRPFGNALTEKIILSKEPLLINQDLNKAYEEINVEKKGEMVESYLGVPIMAGEKSIGVISVQSKEQSNRFSENDLRLLTTIASNVGVAMQNAESYEKLRSALNDLKAAQEQLVQQEKLASLGQLTAGIAHEIKNPLNFVNNFSEVSLELVEEVREEVKSEKAKVKRQKSLRQPAEGKDGVAGQGDDAISAKEEPTIILEILDDIEANLRKIHEHGTRADGIVKSMLQHSRGGSGKVEPTNMNALIKEYVNLAFHGMRAGKHPINVDIDLQLDESVGDIPLIAEDFSRVILNLCNNAFDAMRDKQGSGYKEQGSGDYTPKLTVRTQQKGNTITIDIEDNGPGIPDEMKDKILQPFFTTKKGTDGTGLGLSITDDIIKAHGGEMTIRSENRDGTTFTITLTK